ncbi:MAG: signal peptide peptidase SppA [Muribaculaceae bacterium]|nr:signal peptide peptidase SppA [Muribaculaceae bacterium]
MLKRFFISMLGTVAGVFISGILAFFVILGVAGVLVGKSLGGKSGVEDHSILHIKLDGALEERLTATSLMSLLQGVEKSTMSLEELRNALDAAADDKKVDGVFLDCASFGAGVASCEELIDCIRRFKERSGKWVYAYGDSYTQSAYLIASAADSVFVNPIGSVDVHGTASVTPFFKELLDKVGVKMQIIKVGTYKSAVEPYILNEMSAPARLQSQEYVDSIWTYIAGAIASGRKVNPIAVNGWADSICGAWQASKLMDNELVDAAEYRRVFENRLRELTDRKPDEDLRLITPGAYMAAGANPLGELEEKNHIALLYACGDIVDSGEGGIVGESMVPEIIRLADDEKVKGLVMRVNSGGGSAFASEQIWEALEYFKSKDKPFYVSMGDYAASGGYYISCGADRIYADSTTLTGSIGVFGMIPEASELFNDKLGVHFSIVESNPNAAFPVFFKAMTEQQREAMQTHVDNTYALFTQRVADGRDMPLDSVRAIAEGRVWVGTSALRLGLVDKLAVLADAVSDMADATSLDADNIVAYPKNDDNLWMQLLRESEAIDAARAAAGYSPLERQAMQVAARFVRQNPMQARMPMTMVR